MGSSLLLQTVAKIDDVVKCSKAHGSPHQHSQDGDDGNRVLASEAQQRRYRAEICRAVQIPWKYNQHQWQSERLTEHAHPSGMQHLWSHARKSHGTSNNLCFWIPSSSVLLLPHSCQILPENFKLCTNNTF